MARAAVLGRLKRLPWLRATARDVADETARVRTIAFEVDGWSGHRAGQHLDVRLTAEDGYQAQRTYSISSAPEEALVRISVEHVEGGEVSPYLAGELAPGDVCEIRGPVGGYFTWSVDEGGPLLLVGGGAGVSPLMSMLRHRAAHASEAQVHLLVSARSADDVLFREELQALEPRTGLRIEHTFTRASPPGWSGWSRRIDAEMLADISPGPEAQCFVCGPTPFVEAVNDLLTAAGHDPLKVHSERFGPTGG